MPKSFLILTILFFVSFSLKSQTSNPHEDTLTILHKITTHKDYRINNIIDTHKNSYKLIGYRVQIFSGNKKQPAREVKAKYISLKHKNKAHEIYQQPYFKIRVGDFRTKLEALNFQKELNAQFPNSFIVKDEIDIEELLKN